MIKRFFAILLFTVGMLAAGTLLGVGGGWLTGELAEYLFTNFQVPLETTFAFCLLFAICFAIAVIGTVITL